jgi:outer membrane receptor protein involved in Fe transport
MLGIVCGPIVTAQEPEQVEGQTPEAVEQQPAERTFEGEVTVTGTLIPRPTLDSMSPVTVVDVAEELTLTGTTRIEDLMISLPQVFAGQNSTVSNGATGTASINLRYLGEGRSLVLINGRRMAFGDAYSADINAIPAPLVKRVDILTGGASTVYGSDAVAGVVNFILDTDFTGFRGGVQYSVYQHNNNNELARELHEAAGFDYPSGSTWDGGAINAYVAAGGRFADGRGHASVYVDYRKIDELVKSSRDYLNCAYSVSEDGPYCGGSRNIPRGRFVAFGPDWDYVGDFVLTLAEEGGDGHSFRPRNDEVFNYGPYNHIQRPDDKWNAGGFAHYTINEYFEPYLEVMFMRDYTDAQIAPSGSWGIDSINCDNPMLSDQQRDLICVQPGYGPHEYANVRIRRRNIEGDPRRSQIGHTNYRIVAGLRGDIGDSWSYDLYGLHAESGFQLTSINDLNVERMRNALDVIVDPNTGEWVCRSGGDDGCVPWNIFQEGAVTREATDYISTVAMRNGDSRTRVVNLTFSGDLEDYGLTIPSAIEGLQIAVGAEYRSEFQQVRADEVSQVGTAGNIGSRPNVKGSWDVNELFIEALVPIVQNTRGFRDLSLELGYRYSDYSVSGGFNTYKGLLDWAFTDSWRLRGGYNRAVRAPNIWELFRPQTLSAGGGDFCENDIDTGVPYGTLEECMLTGVSEEQYGNIPSRGGGINTLEGGNPLLDPEVVDTVTAGVVWTPRAIPGLSVTADYYDIEVTDTVGYLDSPFIIRYCADTGEPRFCNRIHRDEVGSLWLTTDSYVDVTNQNIGLRNAEGVDLNVTYLIGLGGAGVLNTNLIGTYLLRQRLADPSYDFDCVGYYGDMCGQASPKWRHRLRATWEGNFNMILSFTWRRLGAAMIDASSPDPDLGAPEWMPEIIASGIDKTPAYDWFDLAASYTWESGVRVTLGVNNIFDEEPPLMPGLADSIGTWFNLYGNYDPLGRHIFTSVEFTF